MYIVRTPYDRSENHWQSQSRVISTFVGVGGLLRDIKWWLGKTSKHGENYHLWRVANESDAMLLFLACGDEIEKETE